MGLGAKLIMAAIGVCIVLMLIEVLSPAKHCDEGQVPVDTIAGIACMPRIKN